jgi:AcrR family transcriptional regulator
MGTSAPPVPSPTPATSAQAERRRRILDATIGLASEGGFDAVQMRAVADRADVALGTLYRYFPSKVHLLVSALGREFERAERAVVASSVPGATAYDRVTSVLGGTTRTLQREPHLTEALTRAFVFADASVRDEIDRVGRLLTSMLTHAMRGDDDPGRPTPEQVSVARVIGDVWLAAMVGWVTGRKSADEVTGSVDVAVALLLRR